MDNLNQKSLTGKVLHDMRLYMMYTCILTLFFWTFSTYKKLVLGQYEIDYIQYEYTFVESLILAKVILIGQIFGLGERFSGKPLIIPTLYKTIVFCFFILAFNVFEHFFIGFLKGKAMVDVYYELISKDRDEILAGILVMSFFFVLFFAFLEIGRVLGDGKLFQLFFKRK